MSKLGRTSGTLQQWGGSVRMRYTSYHISQDLGQRQTALKDGWKMSPARLLRQAHVGN